MLYMVIESFKNGDPVPVYRRFRDQGRLAPEALKYVSSWVTSDMTKCYQLMEGEDWYLRANRATVVVAGVFRGE